MRLRHRLSAVLLVGLLVGVAFYGTTAVGQSGPDQSALPPEQVISPEGAESYVWPYTSRSQSTAGRTLALNVVVHGEPAKVRRIFEDRTGANWSVADPNRTVTVSPWRSAHGSVRYTYLTTSANETGRWVASEYQLAVGAYFGQRTHIRAYPSPSGNWTAIQAHTEYWDWFRLRHTVTGVAPGATFVAEDLRDEPFVTEVSRSEHGLGGGSPGWWTVVELVPALLFVLAVPLTNRRLSGRDAAIVAALFALVLGVRGWGLTAEAVFPGANPKLLVALGYPVLAAGPPAVVFALARERPALRVAALAAAGLLAATTLDLALVGVVQLPPKILFHRTALAAALGVIAFGVARGNRRVAAVGLAAWMVALAAPLAGVL